jgi:hypothetical protein
VRDEICSAEIKREARQVVYAKVKIGIRCWVVGQKDWSRLNEYMETSRFLSDWPVRSEYLGIPANLLFAVGYL